MLHTGRQPGREPRAINYEIEPATYIDRVRSFYYDHADSARVPTHAVTAQMAHEAEVSAVFADEACADPASTMLGPQDAEWLREGFPKLMALVVKASAKAAEREPDITVFSDIDETGQNAVRSQMLDEYVEACMFLAATDKPPKSVYLSSLFLYRNLSEIQLIVEQNRDIGRRHVITTLVRQPVNTEEVLNSAREKIAAAIEMFPTLAHDVIRYYVVGTPNAYERNLRAHAQKHGFVLDVDKNPELPDAETFLGQFREVTRSEPTGLGRLTVPQEVTETAGRFGEEALSIADAVVAAAENPMYAAYADPKVREAYRQKIELLVKAADHAWRHGELTVTPTRLPEELRNSLYIQVLDDFLEIHEELGGYAPGINRVLYYRPDEIRQLVADNPDLPLAYFRQKLPHQPEQIPASMEQVRARLAQIKQANPRLLDPQAVRMALASTSVEAAPVAATDKLPPNAYVESIRLYLNGSGDIKGAHSQQTKKEIAEYRSEIEACFEEAGWQIADLDIPQEFRPAVIKKVEEFIMATNRAYRSGELPATLSGYDPEERKEIYGIVAENYARIVTLLGTSVVKVWQHSPTLYIDAAELTALREEHQWLHNSNFREIVIDNPGGIVAALEKALKARNEVKRLYPGLGDSVITTLVKNSPSTAVEKALDHIRKTTESDFRRYGVVKEPDLSNPVQIYRYYRTFIRYGQMPPPQHFDAETEQGIAAAMSRASAWLRDQEEMENADPEAEHKFLAHVEYCLRASQVLKDEEVGPGMLDQPEEAQIRIIRQMYKNQVDLNELVATVSNGNGSTFRIYDFGFSHEAKYLKALWRQYESYIPKNLVTYVALTFPYRPYRKLNDLVELRAGLLRDEPGLSEANLTKALRGAVYQG